VLEKNLALGHGMNVTGTPTIILANGQRLLGAISADALELAFEDALYFDAQSLCWRSTHRCS